MILLTLDPVFSAIVFGGSVAPCFELLLSVMGGSDRGEVGYGLVIVVGKSFDLQRKERMEDRG